MSRSRFASPAVGSRLAVAAILLIGCQEQQPEPIAPQFAKIKPNRTLTVTGGGTGFGTVTAPEYGESGAFICEIGAGTNDPLECSRVYGWKTTVVLTATARPGSAFAGWSGACTGTATVCRVVMTQSRDVRASFSGAGVASFTLNLGGSGTGSGTVASQAGLSPAINCTVTSGTASSSGCSASYPQGTAVILTATAASENTFTGWSGGCSGSSTCSLTITANQSVTAGFNAPPGPEATYGKWEASQTTPVVGMHLVQLPSGKALMWGHTGEPQLWNGPGAGFVQIVNNTCGGQNCELFCAGHAFLSDGRVLVAGGHNESLGDLHGITQSSTFDGSIWQATGSMAHPRWYPTLVTLADGQVLALSGSMSPGVLANIPERYDDNSRTWTQLTGINVTIPAYSRAFVEPKLGHVFVADGNAHNIDPNGLGSWSAGPSPADPDRGYAPVVMLDSKVLYIGGGGRDPCPANLPRKTVEIIDLAAPAPAWSPTGSMEIGRRHANATILPDGSVLVTGGTSLCGFSNQSGAVFAPELWNPTTGQWTKLRNATVARLYHSSTMLLADGRVLSTAGGDGGGVIDQKNYEIFSPPYLFKGPRPSANLATSDMHYGQPFVVATPNAASIRKVTLIRLASTTHTFDMGQRLNTLPFQVAADGQSLTVTTPAAGKIAPPGPYRIFLVNDQGVPSVGQTIFLTP